MMSTMERVLLGKESRARAEVNNRNLDLGLQSLHLKEGETALSSICCLRKLTL